METRTIHRPSRIAGVRYAAPERLMRSAQACVWASSASPVSPGGLVPDAQSLQRHRGQHAPMGRLADGVEQPLRVGQVAAQAGLQSGDALLANQDPEL